MAISAVLRRPYAAGGVGEVGIESLPTVAFGRERLLLGVYPFAVRVLGADHYGAGRTDHRHPIFFHGAVNPEHEHVIPNHLRVVGGEIAISDAFKFVLRNPLVRLHRQMTSKAAGCPGSMTDLAIHPGIVMGQIAD